MALPVHITMDNLQEALAAGMRQTTEIMADIDGTLLRDLSIHTHSMDGVDKYASTVVDLRHGYKERCEEWLGGVQTPSSSVMGERHVNTSTGDSSVHGMDDSSRADEGSEGLSDHEESQAGTASLGEHPDTASKDSEVLARHYYGILRSARWSGQDDDFSLQDGTDMRVGSEADHGREESGAIVSAELEEAQGLQIRLPKLKLLPPRRPTADAEVASNSEPDSSPAIVHKAKTAVTRGQSKQETRCTPAQTVTGKPAQKKARLSGESMPSSRKGKQRERGRQTSLRKEADTQGGGRNNVGDSEEEEEPEEMAVGSKRRRGRASGEKNPGEKKSGKMLPVTQTLVAKAAIGNTGHFTFSARSFINVELPSQVVKPTTSRGTEKIIHPRPIQLGPFQIDHLTTWPKLLEEISKTVRAEPENLVVSSLQWTWSMTGPKANGPKASTHQWLPLRDDSAFQVLMDSIHGAAKEGSLAGDMIILLSMAQPLSVQHHASLPWVQGLGAPAPAAPTPAPLPMPSPVNARSSKKNESVDALLDKYIEKLKEVHKIGDCEIHPDKRCYTYDPEGKNWHFELDRPRLAVWANALHKHEEGVDYTCPPVGSHFFQESQTLKRRRLGFYGPSNNGGPPVQYQPPPPPPPPMYSAGAGSPHSPQVPGATGVMSMAHAAPGAVFPSPWMIPQPPQVMMHAPMTPGPGPAPYIAPGWPGQHMMASPAYYTTPTPAPAHPFMLAGPSHAVPTGYHVAGYPGPPTQGPGVFNSVMPGLGQMHVPGPSGGAYQHHHGSHGAGQ